jgi:hypothetical protein
MMAACLASGQAVSWPVQVIRPATLSSPGPSDEVAMLPPPEP